MLGNKFTLKVVTPSSANYERWGRGDIYNGLSGGHRLTHMQFTITNSGTDRPPNRTDLPT